MKKLLKKTRVLEAMLLALALVIINVLMPIIGDIAIAAATSNASGNVKKQLTIELQTGSTLGITPGCKVEDITVRRVLLGNSETTITSSAVSIKSYGGTEQDPDDVLKENSPIQVRVCFELADASLLNNIGDVRVGVFARQHGRFFNYLTAKVEKEGNVVIVTTDSFLYRPFVSINDFRRLQFELTYNSY